MKNRTFAEKIISFYSGLDFTGSLPPGIRIMNPFRSNPEIMPVIKRFYKKYYNDNRERHMILGINPGRFGAGLTGIPFTDTTRLREKCGIEIPGLKSHETSSVFVYEMIDRYGGVASFYRDFYISSISPLGFTASGRTGRERNCNYYDSRELTAAILDFAAETIREQINFGIAQDICFCLGAGKNYRFLTWLNERHHFFGKIDPLEHPRFIMQYRSKSKQSYIDIYLEKFSKINQGS